MKVSVFGLGYVGSVSAASFAADGHEVVGVDVNPDKVASLNEGRSPIVEPGLDELIATRRADGALRRPRARPRPSRTELSLLCVGTPSRKNGSLDLTYLERVCEQIGDALRDKDAYHVVVVRSTVLPGTTHDVVIPALERRRARSTARASAWPSTRSSCARGRPSTTSATRR
jgi:GDP-mannose 6-dehydrogenase